ncbi:MAG TPA: response regulator transcription factor [Gammaproteobacteria bacterium]|nr:response regulator transcription factor [Gammaproteobacteria bacterium]
MRVLVIEDDKDVASFIRNGLTQAGYNVDHADNGKDGLFLATTEDYDVLVVDRMLPGVDGLTLIRTLRASQDSTPVLILSALGEVDDRVKGLKAGGDDYLVKPFAFSELLARLEALDRRAKAGGDAPDTVLKAADLEMDLLRREVRRGGELIDLQPREFQLLEFLLRHAGQVVTRTMLLEGVWDYHFDPQTNVIDVHVSRLRSKIDRGFDRPLLHTVRGVGYRLDA